MNSIHQRKMKRKSAKRSKNERKSKTGKCLHKKTKVEADPESENIPPCSTPSQNRYGKEHVRTILAHTPSHLNVTASADHGSPVSAPTVSQSSVKGNLTINQLVNGNCTVLMLNPSDGFRDLLPEDNSDVKEGTYEDYQILPSHNTEQVPQTCESSHRQRRLSFSNCMEQPTLTLAEVKKNTNHLREVTVTGKILDSQPAISILQNEEDIHYSHYILYDTTAQVHLSLAETFIVTLNHWYIFKSLSIFDFGKGNVLCSTELTTLEPFTPGDNLQESEETVISGKVTEVSLTFQYICSCGATLPLSNTTLFRIKCKKCRKSCRCENVQNRATASVTIKQHNGSDQGVLLNDALLHTIVNFKSEGYCDIQQLEDHLLKAERMTVVCVGDEPQSVQIVEQKKSYFSRCVMI